MNFDFLTLYNNVVQGFPNNNAIHVKGHYFTYDDFQQQVNFVIEIIEKEGLLNKGVVIAVSEENHILSIASIIAVFQTGNVLLPFNRSFPEERNIYIFQQVQPQLVLSVSADIEINNIICSSKENYQSWFVFDDNSYKIRKKEYVSKSSLKGIAYILYTSGSTGKPKGVPVSYKNLNSCLKYFYTHYSFRGTDRFLQLYTTTFDVFYFSFLMPLLVGGCCYFIDDKIGNIKYLEIFSALKQYDITVVSMVPAILMYVEKYLKELHFPALRYSFFSGDVLLHSIAEKWSGCLPNGSIRNYYGLTETTIVCTGYVWEKEKSYEESLNNIVPIGKTFPEMDFLIINEDRKPVPKNSIGELAFSGPQVIQSYINNEFSDRFFLDEASGNLFFKTGDFVILNENKTLVFIGRKDFQVKVNGYRIEFAEVEAAVSSITNNASYAFVKTNKYGINVLYVAILDNKMEEKDLLNALKKTLPNYMLPSKIIKLEAFPMNLNQKVDRLLLQKTIND